MKGFHEGTVALTCSYKTTLDTQNKSPASVSSETGSSDSKPSKASLWSGLFSSIFETYNKSPHCQKKIVHTRSNGWTAAVKKVVATGTMRRLHERVLGPSKTGISNTTSDIWLLGVLYKIAPDELSGDVTNTNDLSAFQHDFSSRVLMTYRKGFEAIGDSNYTSDAGWGCMLRSSQMLVAQALLFHKLGRSWRRSLNEPTDREYIEILHLFGDSEPSAFSIHNLLQAGKAYGLAAGSWIGPYATCCSWESLVRCKREELDFQEWSQPMAVYVVSGDEDGERGGAPAVCVEDASRRCSEFSRGQAAWTPILILVPLVLGLDKVNPRYIPSLRMTFTFPQSLGILGGKPGASTYIVGVQDEKAFYLDPHDVQPVVDISRNSLEADTSSYHCNVIRNIPLDLIDPSLAIGFYCRDKDDFDDFCSRASKQADESNGAPLFTVTQTHKLTRACHSDMLGNTDGIEDDDSFGVLPMEQAESCSKEDDWQLL